MFTFLTSGESHGKCLNSIIENFPAGVPVDEELINKDLQRRQMGYGRGDRMKIEKDRVEIMAGIRAARPSAARFRSLSGTGIGKTGTG